MDDDNQSNGRNIYGWFSGLLEADAVAVASSPRSQEGGQKASITSCHDEIAKLKREVAELKKALKKAQVAERDKHKKLKKNFGELMTQVAELQAEQKADLSTTSTRSSEVPPTFQTDDDRKQAAIPSFARRRNVQDLTKKSPKSKRKIEEMERAVDDARKGRSRISGNRKDESTDDPNVRPRQSVKLPSSNNERKAPPLRSSAARQEYRRIVRGQTIALNKVFGPADIPSKAPKARANSSNGAAAIPPLASVKTTEADWGGRKDDAPNITSSRPAFSVGSQPARGTLKEPRDDASKTTSSSLRSPELPESYFLQDDLIDLCSPELP